MKEIDREFLGKGVLLFPKGYVDKNYGEEIRNAVEVLADRNAEIVVLSFRDCPIISSNGMAKLIETIETASMKNIKLWFADLSKLHQQTFDAAGMIELIQKITTTDETRILLHE